MKRILIISVETIDETPVHELLSDLSISDIDVRQVHSFDQAEGDLFECQIALIIIDWELEGAEEFIQALKSDEMFRLLPVMVILPKHELDSIRSVFVCGADNYTARSQCADVLACKLRPLLVNNVLNSELVSKISVLQEQAIHDFILQDIIKKYVPQELYRQADTYAHEQKILIPEEELELTIVFADIRNFTGMSQHLQPSDVIQNLNDVFEISTKHIYRCGGDVDKFVGDAFFAVFRVAGDAVKAMVLIQNELAGLNITRKKDGKAEIRFRIGIYTGPVIRGNVGGNERFDNTMIGDTVNAASRLESICEPGEILISAATREQAGIDVPADKEIQATLRGREGEESLFYVYEVLRCSYS
ncbi:MAG: adenylate/guanylate cyclase domain-containing protein [Spirochaetales bacterium]|nr:adenylate/guanylate cyclase domain-containing protein [Spirochaetales bacterium]